MFRAKRVLHRELSQRLPYGAQLSANGILMVGKTVCDQTNSRYHPMQIVTSELIHLILGQSRNSRKDTQSIPIRTL